MDINRPFIKNRFPRFYSGNNKGKNRREKTSYSSNSKRWGFTLVEILTAISLFSIIIVSLFGFFHSAFLSQGKSLNSIYLLDNASFLSEYMARAIRMAQKDINGNCIAAKANFYQPESNHIKFLKYNSATSTLATTTINECQEFFLQDGALMLGKDGDFQALTPADIVVSNLSFYISGGEQSDFLQPRVTFVLKMENQKKPIQSINIQTTVSQRQLDVEY